MSYRRPSQTRVSPMISASNVLWSLDKDPMPNSEYIKAVLRSYIDVKLARGKTKNECGWKLDFLEQERPQFANEFRYIRRVYGLPDSGTLPPNVTPIRRSASHQPRTYPPQRSNGMTVVRVNTTPLRPARTPPRPAQTQITGDEDEPPPPPYAPDDPEPDQTRILEQRLISEAEAEGRISSELPGEPRYSPPAGPPPLSSSASRRTPPTPNRDRPPTPDSPPADEQVRLAWEESQLDEAKRASLAAEQERLELEEAMRLSLAEAEIAEVASSVAGPSTRPSNPRPLPDPRQSPQYNQFTAAQALSPPLPLRPQTSAESFKRPQQMPSQSSSPFSSPWVSQRASPSIGHRRTASDVGPGMARLSLNEFDPLAEDDGQMSSLPVMQPTQHAAVLQSNNPFLSPRERLETKSSNESLGKPSPPNTATTTTGQIPQPRRTMSTLAEGEDPLEALRTCDTVFLIDDSASMAGEPWEQAKTSLQGVAEIAAQYDDDGIDIYFLNSKRVGTELRTAADVEELFEGLVPKGATPTGSRLDAILQKYLSRLEKAKTYDEQIKPLNLIIVTDGSFALPVLARAKQLEAQGIDHAAALDSASSDDPEVVLVAAAQRLDRGEFPSAQVGVQFLQIGGTAEAHEALQVLDDGLHQVHDVRDIVDTVMFTGETVTASYLIKTLLGGINKRLDQT